MTEQNGMTVDGFLANIAANPEDPGNYFELALLYEKKGGLDDAAKYLREAVILAPKFGKSRLHMGFICAIKGDYVKALDEWEVALSASPYLREDLKNPDVKLLADSALASFMSAVKENPDNPTSHYRIGKAYLLLGRPELAIISFQKASQYNSRMWEAFVGSGDAYSALGEDKMALSQYRAALDINSEEPLVLYSLAKNYEKSGLLAPAIQNLEKALELDSKMAIAYALLASVYDKQANYKNAMKNLQKALDLDPTHPQYHHRLAKICVALFRMDFAVMEYERSVQADPYFSEGFYDLGVLALGLGDMGKAITSLERVTALSPGDSYGFYQLGTAFFRLEDYGRAIRNFEKSCELNPKDSYGFYQLGLSYYRIYEYEQSIGAFNRALELVPDGADYYYHRALAQMMLGDYASAIASLNRAAEIKPGEFTYQMQLADIYFKEGSYDKVVSGMETFLKLFPSSAEAHCLLGQAYVKLNEGNFAFEQFQTALALEPNHIPALSGMAVVYADFRHRTDEAIELYQQVLELDHKNVTAMCAVANLYMGEGRYGEGLAFYEQAYNLSGDAERIPVAVGYAGALIQAGKPEKAAKFIQDIAARDADPAEIYGLYGDTLVAYGDTRGAITQYSRAIELAPDREGYYMALASQYLEFGETESALQQYRAVVGFMPDYRPALDSIAALTGETPVSPISEPEALPQPAASVLEPEPEPVAETVSQAAAQPNPEVPADADIQVEQIGDMALPDFMDMMDEIVADAAGSEPAPLSADAEPADAVKEAAPAESAAEKEENAPESEFGDISAQVQDVSLSYEIEVDEPKEEPAAEVSGEPEGSSEEAALPAAESVSAEAELSPAAAPEETAAAEREKDAGAEPVSSEGEEEISDEAAASPPPAETPEPAGEAASAPSEPPAEEVSPPAASDESAAGPESEDAPIMPEAPEFVEMTRDWTELLLQGRDSLSAGEYESARVVARKILTEDFHNTEALDIMVEACSVLGFSDQAFDAQALLLELTGFKMEQYARIISVYTKADRKDALKEVMAVREELKTEDTLHLKEVCSAFVDAGMVESAIEECRRFIDLLPEDPYPSRVLAEVYDGTSRYALAALQYQKIMRMDKSPDMNRLLAESYYKMNNIKGAKKSFKKYIALVPEDLDVRIRYLEILDEGDEREEEKKQLQEWLAGKELTDGQRERLAALGVSVEEAAEKPKTDETPVGSSGADGAAEEPSSAVDPAQEKTVSGGKDGGEPEESGVEEAAEKAENSGDSDNFLEIDLDALLEEDMEDAPARSAVSSGGEEPSEEKEEEEESPEKDEERQASGYESRTKRKTGDSDVFDLPQSLQVVSEVDLLDDDF